MHLLFSMIIIASVLVFLTCTLPGFLHVTGIHKSKKTLPVICIGLGVLFGIQLLLQFIGCGRGRCGNPRCKCRNCKCGFNCQCDGRNCN